MTMKPSLLLLIFALLLTACQPALDRVSTPIPEPPTSTPAPTETPQTSQAEIATLLTAALQSQLNETCQADPLLCQAYEAYQNSRETDPLHGLALGLLEVSTDNPLFTLAIDPINGEPVVYLDSSEDFAGGLLRPAIGGDEGYLFIATNPYGEKARISHEGPCLANAYDDDGQFLGGVSAQTGQWVDASELTQEDRKAMIAFAGQMELLARQVVDGKIAIKDLQFTPEQRAVFDELLQSHPDVQKLIEKRAAAVMDGTMTMEESRSGLTIEQQIDISQAIIDAEYPKTFTSKVIFDAVNQELPFSSSELGPLAVPFTTDEDGHIIFPGPNGEIITSPATMEFFQGEIEILNLIETNTGGNLPAFGDITNRSEELGMAGIYAPFASKGEALWIPFMVYEGIMKTPDGQIKDPLQLWSNVLNQTLLIGIKLMYPHFDAQGQPTYLRVVVARMHSGAGVRQNNAQIASNWHKEAEVGVNTAHLDRAANSCIGRQGYPIVASTNLSFTTDDLMGREGSLIRDKKRLVKFFSLGNFYCQP